MKTAKLYKLIKSIVFTAAMCCVSLVFGAFKIDEGPSSWVRINQLGYPEKAVKVAVWATKDNLVPTRFQLIDVKTGKAVFAAHTGKLYGSYGPFKYVLRLNFTTVKKLGTYYIKCGDALSPQRAVTKRLDACRP